MDDDNRFSELVREFGKRIDQPLEVGRTSSAAFRFGEQENLGHLQYLEQSETVVLWATVGFLPPDGLAPMRAVRVLQLLDLVPEMHGFTLGAERGTGRLVAASRRPIDELEDVSAAMAWMDELEEAVMTVRTELAEELPIELDDFDADEVDLGDEGEDRDDAGEGV